MALLAADMHICTALVSVNSSGVVVLHGTCSCMLTVYKTVQGSEEVQQQLEAARQHVEQLQEQQQQAAERLQAAEEVLVRSLVVTPSDVTDTLQLTLSYTLIQQTTTAA